jgi:hypothetical protein
MARINFTTGQKDVCPICFLRKQMTEPDALATASLALGCVSAVIADSAIELGELFASACPEHQKGLSQYTFAFSQVSGVNYREVFTRLGARPAGPPGEGTLIHLVLDGPRTVCGRNVDEKWPESERFVYRDRLHDVNCPGCRNQQVS